MRFYLSVALLAFMCAANAELLIGGRKMKHERDLLDSDDECPLCITKADTDSKVFTRPGGFAFAKGFAKADATDDESVAKSGGISVSKRGAGIAKGSSFSLGGDGFAGSRTKVGTFGHGFGIAVGGTKASLDNDVVSSDSVVGLASKGPAKTFGQTSGIAVEDGDEAIAVTKVKGSTRGNAAALGIASAEADEETGNASASSKSIAISKGGGSAHMSAKAVGIGNPDKRR